MPVEQGYQPQVAPGGTTPLPMVSAETQGAGLGRAIESLGGTLGKISLEKYRVERKLNADNEAAELSAQQSAARLEDAKIIADGRASWKPGHADAVAARMTERRKALETAPIVEDDTRRTMLARFDDYATSVNLGEYEFETVKNGGMVVQHHVDANVASFNTIRTADDATVFSREMKARLAEIEDAKGIPDDVKEKLGREYEQGAFGAQIDGMLDKGQGRQALALIDSGALNEQLGNQLDHYRSAAEIEIRRADAVAAQQNAAAEKALRDQVATAKTLNSAGAVQDDRMLGKLAQQLESVGDNSGATELRLIMKTNGMAKVAGAMTPIQRDARIGQLAAIAKPSADQAVELKYLRDVKGSLDSQYNGDRAGFFARNGNPPPEINPSDPATFAARRQWAASTGAPVLTNNEAAQLAEVAAKSPKDRLAVANQLSMFGGIDAVTAARRVSPSDPMLARLVVLRPGDRAAALAGQDARKANPALIDGTAGTTARENFMTRIGGATGLLSQSEVGATFEVARNLYADWAAKNGGQGFDEKTFGSFIHRALGGTKRPGSAEWQGGVGTWGRKQVLLPQGATQTEFDTVLTRVNWSDQDKNAPAWSDGKLMTPAQVRGYIPVQRPDGWYEFHDASGSVVTTKGGGVWRLDIARLAARLPK